MCATQRVTTALQLYHLQATETIHNIVVFSLCAPASVQGTDGEKGTAGIPGIAGPRVRLHCLQLRCITLDHFYYISKSASLKL